MSESEIKAATLIALEEACGIAGGQTALAKAIGKRQGHVSTWLARGKCAPDCVLKVEAATGVSRHRLLPEVFGERPTPAPEDQVAAE